SSRCVSSPSGLPEYATLLGVSADGRVAVGAAGTNPAWAFRWTESGGSVALPAGTWSGSVAYAASADGNVIAGSVWDAGGHEVAAGWLGGGGPAGGPSLR